MTLATGGSARQRPVPGADVAGLFVGRRTPERCLSLFVSKGAVLVERPVGGTSVTTTVSSEAVPDLLAERFEISGVIVGSDGRFTPRA